MKLEVKAQSIGFIKQPKLKAFIRGVLNTLDLPVDNINIEEDYARGIIIGYYVDYDNTILYKSNINSKEISFEISNIDKRYLHDVISRFNLLDVINLDYKMENING